MRFLHAAREWNRECAGSEDALHAIVLYTTPER
ncbi:MAG TPA: hypothetical protein DEP35_20620, partial [Deltaproteobacteria bacterium]|nr:hypothetical protein [Deltaproteobacteria bacterium]